MNDWGPIGLGPALSLAQSGAAASHTGDTNETVLATIPVSAGVLGKNGLVWVRTVWSKTGTAGAWTPKMYFGTAGQGTGGSNLYSISQAATTIACTSLFQIVNLNATNSQAGTIPSTNGIGGATTALPTSAVDTTVATEIVLSATLANSADTIKLLAYQALVYPHA